MLSFPEEKRDTGLLGSEAVARIKALMCYARTFFTEIWRPQRRKEMVEAKNEKVSDYPKM